MAEESGVFVDDRMGSNLDKAGLSLMGFLDEAAQQWAQEIRDWAQDNAPWEDRTGDARAGLDVEVDQHGTVIDIVLFHTVDYGQWLETIQSGRFATIMPTLEHFAFIIFTDLTWDYDPGDS